ncbi:MAG: hypothetical protein HQK78_01820 [Desulfobacterales bacterium]|nr:hypothetical protein [Desulfobacterales bacterium]
MYNKNIYNKIGIIYNEPVSSGDFKESSQDILLQVEAVEESLYKLHKNPVRIPFTRNVGDFIKKIEKEKVKMCFNLCETVDENPFFISHPASILELLGISFSGSSSSALMLSTDKLIAKRLIESSDMITPSYVLYNENEPADFSNLKFPVIAKPRFEDASIGIDQESIFHDEVELEKRIKNFYDRFGEIIVEEYIQGREFNLSLFGYPAPKVLPIAEIDFSSFPNNLHKIVGYSAKWDKNSFEYNNTPRIFPENLSNVLETKMDLIAQSCFNLFMIRDYARIDMRVNSSGDIYILEINANPCLSPDAGFFAAAEKSGLTYPKMIELFLSFMSQRNDK